jgi:hypothetical protein
MSVSDRAALESAAQFELGGRVVSAAAFGSGHINDTFALTVEKPASDACVRFVLQRINPHVFPNPLAVMDNIVRVTRHLREKYAILPNAGRRVLTVVPTKEAKPCMFDEDGACWRCYRMIEGAHTVDAVREPARARTASFAFARFARDLSDLPPPRLQETIPAFHDTPARLRTLDAIVEEDRLGRVDSAARELAEIDAMRHLAPLITDAFAAGLVPERITHNDTKINNVMLDTATNEAICVIDLDTVMPGLALYDFGDLVRVAANPAREDAGKIENLKARRDMYDACAEGFLAGFDGYLTGQEIALMPVAGAVIAFELAVRFLSDYLDGDRYFKTGRPGQNLDRARTQIALARALEKLAR